MQVWGNSKKHSPFSKMSFLVSNICNMLVLRTSNFQGATIRPIVPRHKHSHIELFSTFLDESRLSQM